MIFKFSQALVIAAVLFFFAYLNKQLEAPRIFLIVFYLLLATIFPFIMVPIGLVAILWSLFQTPILLEWFKGLGSKAATSQPGSNA